MEMTRDSDERTLLVSSLWLHGGFIGAAAAGAGMLQWFSGDLGWASALGLVFSGALAAAACWRRGWVVLRNAIAVRARTLRDAASPAQPRASAPRGGAHEVGRALFIDSEVI